MNYSEIAPTKTNLFEFKDQLQFSKDGHSLLEEKREILIMHLMEIVSKIKSYREKLDALLLEGYALLNQLQIESGELEIEKTIQGVSEFSRIEILLKSVMSVNIPTIKYKQAMDFSKPRVSFMALGPEYDELLIKINEIIKIIIIVAQIEASAWKLTYEIKKTQRRVNALENVYIPEFTDIIKYIQETLEERDRETFFQMKKIKAAKEKKKD